MSTFLYIVGGVLLGLVLAPLVLWFAFKLFVKFFLKRLVDAFAAQGGGLPVLRLEADELDQDHEWLNDKAIDQFTEALERRGFRQAGDYALYISPMVNVRGFVHPELKLFALMHDRDPKQLKNVSVVLDIGAVAVGDEAGQQGDEFTVSNAPNTGLDKPSWKHKAYLEIDLQNAGEAVDALLDRMEGLTSGVDLAPTDVQQFFPILKGSYNREMDWYIERGGPQEEELRRNIATMGEGQQDEETLKETIESVQSTWRIAIDQFVSEEIRKRYLNHVTSMSAGEWEHSRDRIYIVHEKSVPDLMKSHLYSRLMPEDPDDLTDEELEQLDESIEAKLAPHFADQSPRAAFESAQSVLPEDRRYKRLARIKSPWKADVYLEPEDEDDLSDSA